SPGDYSGSSHRPQAADTTDQQSVEEDHDDPPWLPRNPMSSLACQGSLGGVGRGGEGILQAEGDHRLCWNLQVTVAGEGRAQSSRTAAGQATNQQANAAG